MAERTRRWAAALGGAAGVMVSGSAWACPYSSGGEPDGGLMRYVLLLGLMAGVPTLLFQMLAPSPLHARHASRLWPMQVWGAVLGLVLLVGLAWRERAAWMTRIADTIRRKVLLEGANPAWRNLAKNRPELFRGAWAVGPLVALCSTLGMWLWTAADDQVTWGTGWQFPVTFAVDTAMSLMLGLWLGRRVAFHVALRLTEGSPMSGLVTGLMQAVLLGGAAGWAAGALFGLSCGVQTYSLVPEATAAAVPILTARYGIRMFSYGMLAGLGVFAMVWRASRRDARA